MNKIFQKTIKPLSLGSFLFVLFPLLGGCIPEDRGGYVETLLAPEQTSDACLPVLQAKVAWECFPAKYEFGRETVVCTKTLDGHHESTLSCMARYRCLDEVPR